MQGWYLEAYDILNKFFYAGSALDGSYEDMILTVAATFMCLCCVVLPFVGLFALCKWLLKIWV